MGWGRPPSCTCGTCKKCKHREYVRRWYRSKTLDERRAMRESRDKDRVRLADSERYHGQQKGDPVAMKRRRANTAVSNAVRDGRLVKQPCGDCGAPVAQAHHDDYDRPLAVRWLCTRCHAATHNPEARAAA